MARPVIANIRQGDPDGNVWDLNDLEPDEFFALNGTTAFDDLIAKLRLDGTGLTADDLNEYDYAFFGTNQDDTITGVTAEEGNAGVIASGNGSDDITAGSGDHVIFAGNGRDTVVGGDGDDIILGENGKDEIDGQDGNDEVRGGAGKDKLKGGLGDDTLLGHNGKDCLTGGEGADELTGGNGPDKFLWQATADFGDVVTDFAAGSDKLKFNVGADEPAISIGNDDEVVDDGEVVIKTDAAVAPGDIQAEINDNGNTTGTLFVFLEDRAEPDTDQAVLYYDPDPSTDGGAVLVAEFENITTLDQLSALSASDFIFV